ncbi:hypothetical protein [Solimonas soli]|uniref:hypothetical protein n=1 Tax=Solimonas soli TaxID=413479 RepID=UPI0006867889|nr:hypothetical protein [Solimonas soli]
MKPRFPRKSTQDAAPPKVRRAPGSPTKSQLQAIAVAEARNRAAKWKTLIPVANALWTKIHAADLARTNGDIHMLSGMVQMHYQASRQDVDRQVKAFFDQHMPSEPLVARPATIATPVAAAPESVIAPASVLSA